MDAVNALLAEFHRRYTERKQEQGLVDFADLELKARSLAGPRRRAQELPGWLPAPCCWWTSSRTPTSCSAPSCTGCGAARVLMVGDERQSIYRFRGADVEVFRRRRAELARRGRRRAAERTAPARRELPQPPGDPGLRQQAVRARGLLRRAASRRSRRTRTGRLPEGRRRTRLRRVRLARWRSWWPSAVAKATKRSAAGADAAGGGRSAGGASAWACRPGGLAAARHRGPAAHADPRRPLPGRLWWPRGSTCTWCGARATTRKKRSPTSSLSCACS